MNKRQQLLYEIAMALDGGEATLPEQLASEVRLWTDQVRVLDEGPDDGRIVLRLKHAPQIDTDKDEPAEGVTVEQKTEPDEDDPDKDFTWTEWTLPTLGKTLYLKEHKIFPPRVTPIHRIREWDPVEDKPAERCLVLSFGGRSWEVCLYNTYFSREKERDGLPLKGDPLVVFKPTNYPVTTEGDYGPPQPGYRGVGVQIFGQPNFAQWDHYPSLNGKSAYLLWSRENGIGDLGLENVFIALDDEGLPCQAWLEENSH